MPLSVFAVIFAEPIFFALTVPVSSTETTDGLLLVQVIVSVVSVG